MRPARSAPRRCAWPGPGPGPAAWLVAVLLAGQPGAPALAQALQGASPATAPFAAAPSVPAPTAPPGPIGSAVLARSSGIERITLAPDGRLIAVAARAAGEQGLAILDAADRHVVRTLALPPLHQLEWYGWAGSGALVLKLSTKVRFLDAPVRGSRLMVYDIAAQTMRDLGSSRIVPFDDRVIHLDPQGRFVLVATRQQLFGPPEVRRLALGPAADGAPVVVQGAFKSVWQWLADANGVVRYGVGGRDGKRLTIWYRDTEGEALRRLVDWPVDPFLVDSVARIAVSTTAPEALLLERGSSGRVVLTRRPLTAAGAAETVHAPADRDVIDFALDRSGRLVSVVEEGDQAEVRWFDPVLQKVQDKLGRAMPGAQVQIVSRAEDNSRMVVWAGNARDPGAYWLYDLRTGNLALFSEIAPGLDLRLTSEPRAVTYTARDGTPIRAYVTLPSGAPARPRALIVMPHGGPFGVRDYLGFDPLAQFLASRGYAVIQPNFRGSSGYGLGFTRLGEGQVGRAMQDDLDDAVDWAAREGLADPARVCLVGASYGGYAALWGVIRNPERYRCAASLAGVTNLGRILRYDRRFLTDEGYDRLEDKLQGADDVDLDALSPERQAARLTRPVLLAHGTADVTVPFAQYEDFVAAARRAGKPIETLVLKDEGHNLGKPESRVQWMEALARFLGRHNPAD